MPPDTRPVYVTPEALSENLARITGDCFLTISVHSVHLKSSSTTQSHVISRNAQIILQLFGVSVMDKKLISSWTHTHKKTQKRSLLILGGLGISQTLFSSWEKRWRWWRTAYMSVFTWTTNWIENATLRLSTRRNRAECTSGGSLLYFSKVLPIFYNSGGEYTLLCSHMLGLQHPSHSNT